MRARSGGPGWRVIATTFEPSGVQTSSTMRSGLVDVSDGPAPDGRSNTCRGGWPPSREATQTDSGRLVGWGIELTDDPAVVDQPVAVAAEDEPGTTYAT